MIGVFLFESPYTLSSEKFGGCTNISLPFLSTIKLIVAGSTRSLLMILVIINFLRLSHFSFHSPGKGYFSGLAVMYHFFHYLALWMKAPTILGKLGSFSKSQIVFQFDGSIQSGHMGCPFRSMMSLPPLSKKLYSSLSTSLSLTVIMKPSKSLSFSNKPRQAYLNIAVFSLSAMASSLSLSESFNPGF